MKFSSILLAAGVASVASSETINGIIGTFPACAINCFYHIVPTVCAGGIFDYKCQCNPPTKAKLTLLLTPCLLKHCTQQQGLEINGKTGEICEIYFEKHPEIASKLGAPSAAPSTTLTPAGGTPTGFGAAPRATAGSLGAAAAAAAIAFAL